ncbi:MAG: DsbA family protein [Acidobacteriota bacterium]|nr:DsbA family protein [Acidobacteriota bacterium]
MAKVLCFLSACVLLACSLAAGGTKTLASDPKCFGPPSAPVTIDLYSDYQCPACRALYLGTITPLMADCVSTGKVYLVEHDFPLSMHAHAKEAAEYANAAAKIHKFETVSNELFQKQAIWAADGSIDAVVAAVLTPAEMVKLRAALKDPGIDQSIANDVALGTKAGLRQTPTMIISRDGKTYPMSGIISYPILKRFLDDLAK